MRSLSLALSILAGALITSAGEIADGLSGRYTAATGFGVFVVMVGLALLVLELWTEPLVRFAHHLKRGWTGRPSETPTESGLREHRQGIQQSPSA